MACSFQPDTAARIVFLTRDPVVHQQAGSTTYALGLLGLLSAQGARVTLVATTAFSRSPRLFFRVCTSIPPGLDLQFPGYLRLGEFYILPLRPKSWARMIARVAVRSAWLRPLASLITRIYGEALYTGAWDLTPPTAAECEAATREIEAMNATAVIANYCIWGPVLADGRLGGRRTAILMHDLLSARVQRFRDAGLPLDCPPITEADEMHWLSAADTVLAAQEREAEAVRSLVSTRGSTRVLVTPVVLQARALGEERVTPGRCLFVGSNIPPNQTGLQFLLHSVWPRVRAEVPGATLAIAGTVGQSIDSGTGAVNVAWLGIELLGVVPSLEEEYARAAVCLVPLLLGTGIKIKLLEALGFGKAVVSTRIGVEGLEAWAAEAVEIADEAEGFAAVTVRLLRDDDHRRRREAAALRLATEHFGPQRPLDPEFVQALL